MAQSKPLSVGSVSLKFGLAILFLSQQTTAGSVTYEDCISAPHEMYKPPQVWIENQRDSAAPVFYQNENTTIRVAFTIDRIIKNPTYRMRFGFNRWIMTTFRDGSVCEYIVGNCPVLPGQNTLAFPFTAPEYSVSGYTEFQIFDDSLRAVLCVTFPVSIIPREDSP
ncbi:unnamed protein product [Calicophoron daubneyi]|uniref:MD-2-related lipid-recognition domain-containing protein n=1 Tax=Calicophoron daubneyi TaxID=300641 RepID=A0AAV2TA84_CALDB